MVTKQKKNNQNLEEIRLNDPSIKTFGVKTETTKDSIIVLGITMDVDKKVGITPYDDAKLYHVSTCLSELILAT